MSRNIDTSKWTLAGLFNRVFDEDTKDLYVRDDAAKTAIVAAITAAIAAIVAVGVLVTALTVQNQTSTDVLLAAQDSTTTSVDSLITSQDSTTQSINALNPIELAMGTVDDYSYITKFGHVDGLTTSAVTVWTEKTIYSYIDEATASLGTSRTLQVASTETQDTALGAGARSVILIGQDTNYVEIQDTVALNGLTPVNTSIEFFRIYRAFVFGVGATQTNIGIIDVGVSFAAGSADTVYATIEAEHGQTQMLIYTVPAGFTAYFMDIMLSTSAGKSTSAWGIIRPLGGAWLQQINWHIFEQAFTQNFTIAFPIPEKTDIELRAIGGAAGTNLSAAFNIVLIPNGS